MAVLSQHRFMQSIGLFLGHVASQYLPTTLSALLHQEPLTSHFCCVFFFIFQDKNKTQIVGGGAPIVFNSKLFSSSLWKGGESILV